MAQVRRERRNPSPPSRQIPPLPDAIRFQQPSSRNVRRTQSFQVNNLPPYTESPIRVTHQQQIINHSLPPAQTSVFHNSINTTYDPLTGLLINPSTTTTTTNNNNINNNNENYGQSYLISRSLNQVTPRERQRPPRASLPSSENLYSSQQQQYVRPKLNNNEVRAIYCYIFK
jgi:hypothetical protein